MFVVNAENHFTLSVSNIQTFFFFFFIWQKKGKKKK
jgi:hypothetical protein